MSVTVAKEMIFTVNFKREPDETWPVLESGSARYRMDELKAGVVVTFVDPAHPKYDIGPIWVRIGYRLRANGSAGARIGSAHCVSGDDGTEIHRFRLECELTAYTKAREGFRDFMVAQMGLMEDHTAPTETAIYIKDKRL